MKKIKQIEPWYSQEEITAVTNYLNSGGWIMEFEKTRELEKMIADYVGVNFCVLLPNGTLTLWAALAVLGVGPGDEVIVPDFTMVATVNAVKLAGATPVFVDINPDNLCLDLKLTEEAVSSKTKAIILVSLNGRCPQVNDFAEFSKRKGLYMIEDAAQSLGSRVGLKHLGSFGVFGSFSFSMPKVITMGQGGALVTNEEDLYRKLLKFKDFGRKEGGSDEYEMLGYNLKYTDLQAVFGIEQMKKLPWRVERKKQMFELYRKLLEPIKGVELIKMAPESTPWFIDILAKNRDQLALFLQGRGVGTRKFYPSLHSLPFYSTSGTFPISSMVAANGLWLPSTANITDEEIKYICGQIKEFYS